MCASRGKLRVRADLPFRWAVRFCGETIDAGGDKQVELRLGPKVAACNAARARATRDPLTFRCRDVQRGI